MKSLCRLITAAAVAVSVDIALEHNNTSATKPPLDVPLQILKYEDSIVEIPETEAKAFNSETQQLENLNSPLKETTENDVEEVSSDSCHSSILNCDAAAAQLNYCNCDSAQDEDVTCAGRGIILNPVNNIVCTYQVRPKQDENLILRFPASGILSSRCFLDINGKIYNTSQSLLEETALVLNGNVSIVGNKGGDNCWWNINYDIEKRQEEIVQNMTCNNGVIETAIIDIECNQGYKTARNFTWNIISSLAKCAIRFKTTFYNDPQATAVDETSNCNNCSVTPGTLVFGAGLRVQEQYGSPQEAAIIIHPTSEPAIVTISDCSAHIQYVPHLQSQIPMEFVIEFTTTDPRDYNAEEYVKSTVNPAVPPSENADNTWVALNGVQQPNVTEVSVQICIAGMANDFLRDNGYEGNITADEVWLLTIGGCHILYCPENCLAFNFLIHFRTEDGYSIFTTEVLDQMLRENFHGGCFASEITICEEFPETEWRALGSLVIILTMSGALVALICWLIRDRAYHTNLKNKFNRRWRSSSSASLDTMSSSAPMKSNNIPLPGFGNSFAWYPPQDKKLETTADFANFEAAAAKAREPKHKVSEHEMTETKTTAAAASYSNAAFAAAVEDDEVENEVYSRDKKTTTAQKKKKKKNENIAADSGGDSDSDFEAYFSRAGAFTVSGMDTGESAL